MAYLQRAFIPVFRYVKMIEIHQDVPELKITNVLPLFYEIECMM